MADPISSMITHKKVIETVASAGADQANALAKIKDLAGKAGGLVSGMSNILSNAQNVLSQSISGISSAISDSVKAFAEKVNVGLTTTLTDLSKKAGSMISELAGKTGVGAVAEKLSYIVNNVDATINATSVFGKVGNIANLVSEFSKGQLGKMVAATGLSQITNNSDIVQAVTSISGSLSSMTAAAKSIVGDVLDMPGKLISAGTSLVDNAVGGLISKVTDSVTSLAKTTGIGDLGSLIKDTYDLYSMGRGVYDAVTGKDNSVLVGIASQVNNSFPQVQNLLNAASTICKSMNSRSIQNYAANKDLMDLLLMRMANQGMYGAIQNLMNCSDTQQYIDESTYFTLARKFGTASSNGDVRTASTIQSLSGNSKLSNVMSNLFTLGTNIDDKNRSEREEYQNLLRSMNVSGSSLFQNNYTSRNGSSTSIFNASSINRFSRSSPNLFRDIMGDTPVANIATALVSLF